MKVGEVTMQSVNGLRKNTAQERLRDGLEKKSSVKGRIENQDIVLWKSRDKHLPEGGIG